MIEDKKGIDFGFGWMFAIIVGAIVIFLAIYAVTQLGSTQRTVQDSTLGGEFANILNPVETSVEDSKISNPISVSQDLRVYNSCQVPKDFPGYQLGFLELAVASQSGIGTAWQEPGANTTLTNDYLFSTDVIEGNTFYPFTVPIDLPYKVGDAVIMWSNEQNYCFVDAPESVQYDLEGASDIYFNDSVSDCPQNTEKVCFDNSGCDVDVDIADNALIKNGTTLYFSGNLIYPAIFSDPDVYECNLQRIVARTAQLASLYYQKSLLISTKNDGCSSDMQPLLQSYSNISLSNSSELNEIVNQANQIGEANDEISDCKIF